MKRPLYLHWVVYSCAILLIGIVVTVWIQHLHGLIAGVVGAGYGLRLAAQNKRRQDAYDWARDNPEEARKWLEATEGGVK